MNFTSVSTSPRPPPSRRTMNAASGDVWSPSRRATRAQRLMRRSTSRNNNAPAFEEIDPPKKFHRTWRLRQFENETASWLHSVTVWLLVRSSTTN